MKSFCELLGDVDLDRLFVCRRAYGRLSIQASSAIEWFARQLIVMVGASVDRIIILSI